MESWTERTRADGADWAGQSGFVDRRSGGRGGLRNPGRGGVGRTGRTGRSGADGAEWGGRGGVGWMGQSGADGGDWGGRGGGGRVGSRLEGHKGRTRRPGAGVLANWADRLGCARLGQLASLRFRAEGILGVLSPDANCGVIWLHTPRIHIRFFGAHVVVLFLGTHTSKVQRSSTSDKFFGLLGALNITYSMFIQMCMPSATS